MNTIRILTLCAFVVLVVAAASVEDDFESFKVKYGRNYATALEESRALAAFRENVARIADLNKRNPSAKFAVNRFADVSVKDFASRVHGAKPPTPRHAAGGVSSVKANPKPIVNWVKAGGVTPVIDQGACASDSYFSAIYNIEGVNFATNKKLVPLSVQEIIDCDTLDNGCDGGFAANVYKWLLQNQSGKVMTAASWPYDGTASKCSFANRVVGATITSSEKIKSDETVMAEFVANVGPVAALVDASTWQFYQSGVMTSCSAAQIDHSTTIVGYNDKSNPPYWMLKNTWGSAWGMEGYIYIEKGQNTCGITTSPMTAHVKKE